MMGRNGLGIALALSLSTSVNAIYTNSASSCCNFLGQSLPNNVYTPSTPAYNASIHSRWSGTSVLEPACVIIPQSAEDVSAAMKLITKNQCKFSVKSGGHNANPGANSINGGVSIDLSSLNSTSLAADRSYVSLGSGVTWGEAYDAFNSSNIGFTGGICEDVGVGGVALGGGQSLFAPKRGWAVDNVLNYEIVLASGEIVNANETSNSDLFKALKGGNTNFGIVTRVDLEAFDFEGLWGGEVYVNLTGTEATRSDVLDQMSHAITNFTANNHLDTGSAVQLMTVYLSHTGGLGQIVNAAFGNTDGVEKPESIQPFLKMPNQVLNQAGPVKMADFVHQVSKFQAKGYRQVTASLTFNNDYDTIREIWDATDAIYDALPSRDEVDWMVSFIPQAQIQQTYAAKRGGNSLGLTDVPDQIVVWLTSRWTDPSLDEMMEGARQKFVDDSVAIAKKHDTYYPFLYVNYAAPFQNPLCGYGNESVEFLKKTASKYDPDGVFQTLMPGGFKVGNLTCA